MKKFLCILISVIMLLSLSLPAFAAGTDVCPVINLEGIAASDVYADIDDPESELGFPPTEVITEAIKNKLIPALVVYSADRNIDKLAGVIAAEINKIMEGWFNNSDGSAKENSGTIMNYPEPSSVTKNSKFTFSYDWRGNPLEIASDLNSFIEYIRVCSGCDKVALTCHSLGSVIVLSYLSLFGDDKISGIVFDTPAIDGVSYVGDLLCGEVELTGESLSCFLKTVLTDTEYEELVSGTVDVFELGGIPDMLAVFLDDILEKIAPVIYKETLIPLLCYWPTVWSMCPDDRIDEAIDYIFNNICKDEDLSVLKGKVVAYNSLVRNNKKSTLLNFDEEGKIAVISRYGFSSMPITESWNVLCDNVVDTKSSSFGATTAPVGECFDDEYLDGKNSEYISPDRTVDASTCLFPEKTWYIKNASHEQTKITKSLYDSLLFSENEQTCDTYSYPRFLILENGTLNVDNTSPEKKEEVSSLMKLFNFLKAVLNFFLKFFTK